MIVRYGFYEGRVRPDRAGEFDAYFRDVVVPGLAAMPGIIAVRLLRGLAPGHLQPRFHHLLELTCSDEDALVAAMQSQQRRALQAGPWKVMEFYEGATPHGNFEVSATADGQNPIAAAMPAATGSGSVRGLARIGRAGMEKPVAIYEDGEIRDVSILLSEIDRSLIGADWPTAVAGIDRTRLPWVDNSARRGPCVEYHGRLIAVPAVAPPAPCMLGAALRAGQLAGATDPLSLPSDQGFVCRVGLAAVVGASGPGNPAVSGVCLFLAVEPTDAGGMDAAIRAVVASAPGLLSLGPLLASFDDWRREAGAIRLTVNGVEAETVSIDAEELQAVVARLNDQTVLATGDILLVGALAATDRDVTVVQIASGDEIAVTASLLGAQNRVCR